MCTNTHKHDCVCISALLANILICYCAYWFCVVLSACPYTQVVTNMLFLTTAFLTFSSDFPRSDFIPLNCVLMASASLLTSNRRNMCMFSLYWLSLSCSSLSHACTHKHTQIHIEVLWSGKGLKLSTFPTSFTLRNTNNTGQTCTKTTQRQRRGEARKGEDGNA